MGDTCFLRPLIPEIQGWKGVEVEARVYAIERIKGEVVLSVDQHASNWLKKLDGTGEEIIQREGEDEVDAEESGISVNVIWKIQGKLLRLFIYRRVSSLKLNPTDPSRSALRRLEESNRNC
jgi:hypothetical protein